MAAIHSTTTDRPLQTTDDTLDRLAGSVDAARDRARPRLQTLAEQAETLVQRSSDALHEGSALLRARTQRASEHTVAYIRDEPVKSVLFAAAAGAAMLAVASLLTRPR